jgi:hypothetical protein
VGVEDVPEVGAQLLRLARAERDERFLQVTRSERAVVPLLLGEQIVQLGRAVGGQSVAISLTWVSRMWLPDGSRKPASIP